MRTLLPVLLILLAGPVLAGTVSEKRASEKPVRWTTAPDAERAHALRARLKTQVAVSEAPAPERLASGGERLRVPVEAFQVLWLRPAASDPSQATAPRAVCRAASEAAPGPAAVPATAVEK